MTNTAAPALSVVIVTPDSYSRIRKTMRHLRAQTVSDRLEVLIGAPSVAELGLDEAERDGFFDVRAVEVGEIRSAGAPRARAAGEARAPLVVFAEDHSFPDPGWAETLIQAFEQGWNCLGASMGNANPATARSWADLFLNSGPSVLRESGGESRFIPWHNSAYSRELLDACAPQLPLLLDAEGVLQMRLARRGERFYQTNALTEHVNMAPWRSFAGNQYWGARLFWSTLAAYEQWPLPRRLLFAAASPALAAVRTLRALRDMRRAGKLGELLPGVLPPLLFGAAAIAAGAASALLFGPGRVAPHRISIELHRVEHLLAEERKLLEA